MKYIQEKNTVNSEVIKAYDEIDGLLVIEELLLHKGVEICDYQKAVSIRELEHMALVVYNLKVNPTNKLHVGMRLDKFYLRNDLINQNRRIKVPKDIYDRVKQLNDKYKNAKL